VPLQTCKIDNYFSLNSCLLIRHMIARRKFLIRRNRQARNFLNELTMIATMSPSSVINSDLDLDFVYFNFHKAIRARAKGFA